MCIRDRYNSVKGKKERIGRILQMHANKREEIEKVYAGDIAAAVGLKDTTTGDTLCDEKHQIILESMDFPDPVIEIAIEPKTKAGQEKMGVALAKLAEEDPTFKTYTNHDTGQTIIAGMGELHLDIIVDRLLREFKVEANVGKPQVSYKETLTEPADVDYKYAKQSGGRGQYGHVKIRVYPREAGSGYEFKNSVVGGAIPKEYISKIDEGIQEAMQTGILAGYQVVDVGVELYDGSYHEVDSSEMAFKIAASMAFKEASRKAKPVPVSYTHLWRRTSVWRRDERDGSSLRRYSTVRWKRTSRISSKKRIFLRQENSGCETAGPANISIIR